MVEISYGTDRNNVDYSIAIRVSNVIFISIDGEQTWRIYGIRDSGKYNSLEDAYAHSGLE